MSVPPTLWLFPSSKNREAALKCSCRIYFLNMSVVANNSLLLEASMVCVMWFDIKVQTLVCWLGSIQLIICVHQTSIYSLINGPLLSACHCDSATNTFFPTRCRHVCLFPSRPSFTGERLRGKNLTNLQCSTQRQKLGWSGLPWLKACAWAEFFFNSPFLIPLSFGIILICGKYLSCLLSKSALKENPETLVYIVSGQEQLFINSQKTLLRFVILTLSTFFFVA